VGEVRARVPGLLREFPGCSLRLADQPRNRYALMISCFELLTAVFTVLEVVVQPSWEAR